MLFRSIESNVDFLRSMEDSDSKKDKGHSKPNKRSSLGSLSSGTKNIFAGKFGDAFKRFEGNTGSPGPARTPSPLKQLERQDLLTPIAGSEATDGRSDDGEVLEEVDDMSPEQRREIERRRLSMEEKRVAAAAAEYRQRVAQRNTSGMGAPPGPASTALPKSIGGVSRAVSIQNRVQNLLNDAQTSTSVTRSAEGYGHYADQATAASRPLDNRPDIPRKPIGNANFSTAPRPGSSTGPVDPSVRRSATVASDPMSSSSSARPGVPPKPMAKPKPIQDRKSVV